MKYVDCMIGYNSGGPIEVGPHPDRSGWSKKYRYSVGACFLKAKDADLINNHLQMLLEFHHAVVRDQVPVADAHRAFWAIDEYRDMMAEDVPDPTKP